METEENKKPPFVYPSSEDYKEEKSGTEEKKETTTGTGAPTWSRPTIIKDAGKEEPEEEDDDAKEEKKEKQEKKRNRLKRLSELAPRAINFANKEFAIPAHTDIVYSKFKPEEVEEYLKAIDNFNNGVNVIFTDASRKIHSQIKSYEKKAILDDQDQKDIAECVADLIEHYSQTDVEINPWLMLLITVGMIEGPVLAPILAPKIKSFFGAKERVIEEKKPDEMKEAA